MKIKKGDLFIVIMLIIAASGWAAKDLIWPDTTNKLAIIKVGSEVYTTVPLASSNERKEIPIELPDHNYVHIVMEKDEIWVEDASCPDKVCVKTGKISKSGQSIVCLPNKTVVYIEGADQLEVDDVTF